jgi:hypothetical protein
MKAALTSTLIVLNVSLAVGYLVIGSNAWWMEPELADVPGASGGGPFVWFVTSLWALGLLVLINGAAGLFQLYMYLKRKEGKFGWAVLLIPVLWAATVIIDFSHH